MARPYRTLSFSAALAVALAGCGGGGSSAPSQTAMNPGTVSTLSVQQQTDVVYSLTHDFGDSMETGLGGATSSIARSAQALNPCITPSPKPPVIDADGIPANETYTYTNCRNLGWSPGETVNGQVNITDTSPAGGTGATLSYTQTNTNLSIAGSDNGTSYSEVENGQRFPSVTANVLSVTRAMQVVRTNANGTSNIGQSWSWSLTPSGGTVALLQPWPAGTINPASGTISYANGSTSATISFSNSTPMSFDPSCGTAPRFTAGTIAFTVTGGSKSGQFTATWNGCGPPIIAQVGGGSSQTPAPTPTPVHS